MTTLRPYQREAVDAAHNELRSHRATLLVMPTGCGKTQCFGAFASEVEGRVLVLAHRTELIQQARARLEQMTGEWIDVEQAGSFAYSSRIVVGSMASVAQTRRLERLGRDAFQWIIIDECHRSACKSYAKILAWFRDAKVLGVTATPDRGDNKALGDVFDSVAYRMDILDAITDGWLVQVEAQRIHLDDIDISTVKTSAGDLQAGQLNEAMLKAAAGVAKETCDIVGPGDGQGVAFFPGIESGLLATEWFNRCRPDSARFVCGKTDPDERAAMFRDFAAGRFQFLVNVMVATEGWDCPPTRWCIMARPTKSRGLYAQAAGRVTRPLPGTVDGPETAAERCAAIAASAKPSCTILDFYGNTGKHDLCTPIDVLGGKFADTEVQRAKQLAAGGERKNVVDALKASREHYRRIAAAHEAKVRARRERADAFRPSGLEAPDTKATRWPSANDASQAQLGLLAKLGVRHVDGLTKKQASALIDKHLKTRVATPRQLAALRHHVRPPSGLSFTKARRALDYVMEERSCGRAVDPRRVAQLLGMA